MIRDALILYRDSTIGFVDAVVATQAKKEEKTLVTFDKKLKKLSKAL